MTRTDIERITSEIVDIERKIDELQKETTLADRKLLLYEVNDNLDFAVSILVRLSYRIKI